MKKYFILVLLTLMIYTSCAVDKENEPEVLKEESIISLDSNTAFIEGISISGNSNDYSFSVTVDSPDTGCDQYANWWEIISEDGQLIYRRILGHSHVNEQPFSRSGSNIDLLPNQKVWIRVHMNNTGYSNNGMMGSISEGFVKAQFPSQFAIELEAEQPLPSGCAF